MGMSRSFLNIVSKDISEREVRTTRVLHLHSKSCFLLMAVAFTIDI